MISARPPGRTDVSILSISCLSVFPHTSTDHHCKLLSLRESVFLHAKYANLEIYSPRLLAPNCEHFKTDVIDVCLTWFWFLSVKFSCDRLLFCRCAEREAAQRTVTNARAPLDEHGKKITHLNSKRMCSMKNARTPIQRESPRGSLIGRLNFTPMHQHAQTLSLANSRTAQNKNKARDHIQPDHSSTTQKKKLQPQNVDN